MMYKHVFMFLTLSWLFLACQNTGGQKETSASEAPAVTSEASTETFTLRYRCDGFYPGIASEWLEVVSAAESPNLVAVYYWSTADEKKLSLNIVEQMFSEGEISGWTGILRFPNSTGKVEFGAIEDRFNLIFEGDRMQEFTLEDNL